MWSMAQDGLELAEITSGLFQWPVLSVAIIDVCQHTWRPLIPSG